MCNNYRCDETFGCTTVAGVMRHLDFNSCRCDETLDVQQL